MEFEITAGVKKMLLDDDSVPAFFASHNFGRGLYFNRKDSPHIVASQKVLVWKIVKDSVQNKNDDKVLFDEENYIVEWHFDYVLYAGGPVNSERFLFHWKGMNALKGFSPLPPNRDLENTIVERIYQWSEPPIFFHIFPKSLIVLSGKEECFDPTIPHLLMVRGEVLHEIHLFEIPCCWKNFRSRAVFFLIVPQRKSVYLWIGTDTNPDFLHIIKKLTKKFHSSIQNIDKTWADLNFIEVNEGQDEVLKEIVAGNSEDYLRVTKRNSFSPRLFYLVFNGDNVSTIEIKYPLRAPNTVAPFCFLQSHVFSAVQPAIFLLDNSCEVWLWKGVPKSDYQMEIFNKQLKLAEELLSAYVKEKQTLIGSDIKIRYTSAAQEPIAFTNIFPFWKS